MTDDLRKRLEKWRAWLFDLESEDAERRAEAGYHLVTWFFMGRRDEAVDTYIRQWLEASAVPMARTVRRLGMSPLRERLWSTLETCYGTEPALVATNDLLIAALDRAAEGNADLGDVAVARLFIDVQEMHLALVVGEVEVCIFHLGYGEEPSPRPKNLGRTIGRGECHAIRLDDAEPEG